MELKYFENQSLLSKDVADIIFEDLNVNPELMLCAASGSSPKEAYNLLADRHNSFPDIFQKMRILKLDEWGGISMNNPESAEVFLQKTLVKPLKISDDRYISFNSSPVNPKKECKRIANYLDNYGPSDICVLGLGLNGHIAFNEPADFLQSGCHIASLSEKSMQHPMALNMGETPKYGLTLGMTDIMLSKKIILIISGSGKKDIIEAFLSGNITTTLPASLLWLHPNVQCFLNKADM